MIHATTKRIDWTAVKAKLHATQTVHESSSTVDDPRIKKIFRDRAERLAASNTQNQAKAKTTPVLVFRVGDETYGIELRYVARVFPDIRITPVPGAPQHLLGIANLQGEVRSVFGLRQLLALPAGDYETNFAILLLRQDTRRVGLQVQNIEGVRQVALEDVIQGEHALADQRTGYVHCVTGDQVIILRTNRLFES